MREGQLDAHLLGCGHCSANLQSLVELAGEVRAAVRAGAIHAVLPDAFVKRLAVRGLRVREYRVPHNGSVNCTVAPEDDVVITRLDAPLAGVERLDIEHLDGEGASIERLCDVPFDATLGEVVFTSQMKRVRALPAVELHIRLLAIEPSSERVVGEYTLHHMPYRPGDSS